MIPRIWSAIATLLFCAQLTLAFYLPGVAPTNYKAKDPIQLLVNHLTPSLHQMSSSKTNKKTKTPIYSYDYYYPKFRFCKPKDGAKKQLESLGAIILGDRIFNSPFEINMLEEKKCQTLCLSTYEPDVAPFVNRNIRAGYSYNWIVDGLPAARKVQERRNNAEFYSTGFPIGGLDEEGSPFLYNHFNIHIEYHKRSEDNYRVVGVLVDPASYDRKDLEKNVNNEALCDTSLKPVKITKDASTEVIWTYSVTFEESKTAWATRWDKYLHVYDPTIQWFSLVNFSLVVIILGVIMGHILVSTLKNDIVRYNEVNLDDDVSYESGWKLVYGDVFRSPPNRMLLSVIVGSGAQLFCMMVVTIAFSLLGLLSPSNRGALFTFILIIFMLFSVISAYVSGYLYRLFGGENWKMNMILTPVFVPGIAFGSFIVLNFFLISVKSSGALPFGTMVAMIAIWFAISVPLSVVGSLWQSKRALISVPVRTNQIPRQIPIQPWYLGTAPSMILCGLFPFGSIAVELYFILTSIWFSRIYYMFGFLFFCLVLMILTTALISVLCVYYTLCSENYKWQWRSVLVGGSCAIYVFIHSFFLLGDEALQDFTSVVLYLGYSALISLLVFIVCGTVGFLSSFLFVRKIYAQVKID